MSSREKRLGKVVEVEDSGREREREVGEVEDAVGTIFRAIAGRHRRRTPEGGSGGRRQRPGGEGLGRRWRSPRVALGEHTMR